MTQQKINSRELCAPKNSEFPCEADRDWRQIAQAICNERDPEKLSELMQQLADALDNRLVGRIHSSL